MTVSILVMILLIIVVFGFVLEPVIRGRRDRVEIDAAELPEPLPDFLRSKHDQPVQVERAGEPRPRAIPDAEAAEGGS